MKQKQITRGNNPRNNTKGLPLAKDILRKLSIHKRTETIAAKVELPLKNYVKKHGGSAFIRQAIIEKLQNTR